MAVALPRGLVLALAVLLLGTGCAAERPACANADDCELAMCGQCNRFFQVCNQDEKLCVMDCDELCALPRPDLGAAGDSGPDQDGPGSDGPGSDGPDDLGPDGPVLADAPVSEGPRR